ncbi:hypothetical protein PM082_018452 [Marasmius tenuissimus]|nr:hypothetical protein PM082_018452 [Marasmius tenuissimus]
MTKTTISFVWATNPVQPLASHPPSPSSKIKSKTPPPLQFGVQSNFATFPYPYLSIHVRHSRLSFHPPTISPKQFLRLSKYAFSRPKVESEIRQSQHRISISVESMVLVSIMATTSTVIAPELLARMGTETVGTHKKTREREKERKREEH